MSNVKQLPGTGTLITEPNETVVAMLEDFLAKAKAGDIRSVAIAAVGLQHNSMTAYHTENQTWSLIGSTQYLVGRMVNVCDNSN